MATHIITQTSCDHPDHDLEYVETVDVDVWVYKAGKGRKPAPVRINLCDEHAAEVTALFAYFQRVGDPDSASVPEVRK